MNGVGSSPGAQLGATVTEPSVGAELSGQVLLALGETKASDGKVYI